MKLYYFRGACSMAPHIVLRELGLGFDMEAVELPGRKTKSGEDYLSVTGKGYVPALKLDDGTVLTEVAVILQYLSDQKPNSDLAPKAGTLAHYQLQEWLNFIASEIHKTLSPLFNPKITPECREGQIALLGIRLDYLVKALGSKPFLMGDTFTLADAYLFTILNWHRFLKVDLDRWPVLHDYQARIAARPSVKATLKAEGLAK